MKYGPARIFGHTTITFPSHHERLVVTRGHRTPLMMRHCCVCVWPDRHLLWVSLAWQAMHGDSACSWVGSRVTMRGANPLLHDGRRLNAVFVSLHTICSLRWLAAHLWGSIATCEAVVVCVCEVSVITDIEGARQSWLDALKLDNYDLMWSD
jgi:hypothetical protein